jgi:Trk K+ transport system NAD-binding subunit
VQQPRDSHYNALHNSDERQRRLRRRPRSLWRIMLAGIYDFFQLLREARVVLIGFTLLAIVNAGYLLFYYDHAVAGLPPFSLISALYETMKMMTLESDLPIPERDLLGDVLFFTTPILGLALVFQGILNFGRFVLDKGSRREGWQLALARTYRSHVIVCGLGSVTYRIILDLLEEGYGVVAIEPDWSGEFVEPTLALEVPVIQGDARSGEALLAAGLLRARSLVAGSNDDLVNIEIGLAARRRRNDLSIILRIFDEDLDLNLEQTFGHNSVFSTSTLAAPTLAAAAMGRSIAHVLPLPPEFQHEDGATRFKGILQLTIRPDSEFVGPLRQLEERLGIRALMHFKGHTAAGEPRRGDHRQLESGDTVALIGALERLEQARVLNHGFGEGSEVEVRSFSPSYDTVIVCGLGKIGTRVIRDLDSMRPRPRIVLVYQLADTRVELFEQIGCLLADQIVGDARRSAVLEEAGIHGACALIAVTSDDLTNLQIGLAARKRVPDIDLVLRVYNEDLAGRLELMFGAHTTFSVAGLAAPTFAAAAVLRGINYAIELDQQLLSTTTLRVQAGDELDGRSVNDLRERTGMLALALRRRGEDLAISLETCFAPDDQVAVLIDVKRLEKLRLRSRLLVER